MKALIQENDDGTKSVVQVEEVEFDVHSSLTWMPAPEECKAGWTLEDGVLVAPPDIPEKTYDIKRKEEYKLMNQFEMQFDDEENGTTTWNDAIKTIKAKYPKPT